MLRMVNEPGVPRMALGSLAPDRAPRDEGLTAVARLRRRDTWGLAPSTLTARCRSSWLRWPGLASADLGGQGSLQPTSARTFAAWPSARTLYHARWTVPSGPTRKVERMTPTVFFPYSVFSPNAP